MKGRAVHYSADELEFIRSVARWNRVEAHGAFCQKFGRDDVSLTNFNALCKRKGWLTGRTGRFEGGQAPHNKGKPCEPGKGGRHANARRTQFRKGGVPQNIRPLWSERLGKNGYIEMKVPLRNPYTGHSTRFMHKHRYLWEQANGPLPKGMALKCLDGDIHNTAPSNWEAIPRAMLPRLAGGNRYHRKLAYADAAPEVRPALLAVAKIEHRARELQKAGRDGFQTGGQ